MSVAAVAWEPTESNIGASNIGRVAAELGLRDYEQLHRWSVEDRAQYWQFVIKRLAIRMDQPYSTILDLSDGPTHPRWLPGARMNIVNSCFCADLSLPAIIYRGRDESLTTMTYAELAGQPIVWPTA